MSNFYGLFFFWLSWTNTRKKKQSQGLEHETRDLNFNEIKKKQKITLQETKSIVYHFENVYLIIERRDLSALSENKLYLEKN